MKKIIKKSILIAISVVLCYMNTYSKNIENSLPDFVSYYEIKGETYFDAFLKNGGAKSDSDVVMFLYDKLKIKGIISKIFNNPFGCTSYNAKSEDGGYITGRNFDYTRCNQGIIKANPKNGFKSIGTVDIDFIGSIYNQIPEELKSFVLYYAVLDGINEKGVTINVNMIEDDNNINQTELKNDITTTTAIRLILDKASNVDEAINLLKNYNFHSSKGITVHFFISDNTGKSVAVEYIDNKMSIIETNILTNYYLTQGEKYGIGTQESHKRYEICEKLLKENPEGLSIKNAFDILSKVSKKNFSKFSTTEWSIVFDKQKLSYNICFRENFEKIWTYYINE